VEASGFLIALVISNAPVLAALLEASTSVEQ